MPEGDTVFLTGRRLAAALTGKPLVRGEIRHPRWSTVEFAGRSVRGVRTVGKHLFLQFDDDRSLHHHLRLDGSWYIYAADQRWGARQHEIRAVFGTDAHTAVGYRLHDLVLLPTAREAELVRHLGPDLLGDDWDDTRAAEAARRLADDPHREIGLALLDQRVMAGVGNLYKAEVCFLLGVSPWSPVSDVDAVETVALCRKLLLTNAWRPQQSTTGSLAPGRQNFVYRRDKRPCLRCGTPIRVGWQGTGTDERGTWFCPTCQPGPHP